MSIANDPDDQLQVQVHQSGRGAPLGEGIDHESARRLREDVRRFRADARELRSRMDDLASENRRLRTMLASAAALVRAMEAGIGALQRSISLQIGYLITQSARSVGGMISLPFRVVRLALAVRRRARAGTGDGSGDGPQLVDVPLPYGWFPSELRNELAAFYSESAAVDALRNVRALGGGHAGGRAHGLPTDPQDVRVAAIMDEFTFSAFRDCCNLMQVTPDAWKDELEEFRPHLCFIESAWDGRDGLWQRKVSNASDELRMLVAHCRERGIPVVFWSKEDPVHFKTFLKVAKLADVVFTTDIDCIRHYKAELGHERVFLLPFATQPRAHDPIERYTRKHAFCFAGSYYVRYPVRQRDFANLIDAVSVLAPVEIYDRNHGKTHPNYVFPEAYRSRILGGLPFDQIDIAYKGYEFGININTVKHSQSMFARRVFDLLASNTITVSNFSRGLRRMFGDLVVSSDDPVQLVERLAPLVDDAEKMAKFRLAGLRKVMSEHTYQHRFGYVLEKVMGEPAAPIGPRVFVVAGIGSEDALAAALENFERQRWERKQLLLCLSDGFIPGDPPHAEDIALLTLGVHGERPLRDFIPSDGFVTAFASSDYYGPSYLLDLALAVAHSPVPIVGKSTHYRVEGGELTLAGEAEYRLGSGITLHRALASIDAIDDATPLASLVEPGWSTTGEFLGIDRFNYCADAGAWPGEDLRERVDDLPGLDHGMSISTLQRLAEGIGAGVRDANPVDDGIEALSSSSLRKMLGELGNKYLAAEMQGGDLAIVSTVAPGRHAYAYAADAVALNSLNATDVARMQLACEPSEGLELVLVFKDGGGTKLGHAILKSATNVTAAIPGGTAQVQVGLRVSAPGRFIIRRLALDHVPLSVDRLVPASTCLLIAKNYPSYEDIYKHVFVHRRVVEYKRLGFVPDVFRVGSPHMSYREFEGVDVAEGTFDHLGETLASKAYRHVFVHVLTEQAWGVLKDALPWTRVYVWAHGSEVQDWKRRAFEYATEEDRRRAAALGERRMAFWRSILRDPHPNLVMVYVSRYLAEAMFEDLGFRLPESQYRVIHNFVDERLFPYRRKSADLRKRILSIRPYASRVYANDLAVQAILELSRRACFDDLEFHLVGDGPLFDDTVAPLRGFPNVVLDRRFLSQAEISELHAGNGVFLCPTRMDSQGLSRDEAMASGLVPVTNAVAAVPEFVDEGCGMVVEPEDPTALADAIERLYRDPALFGRLSESAAARVRRQSGHGQTIAREMELLGSNRHQIDAGGHRERA